MNRICLRIIVCVSINRTKFNIVLGKKSLFITKYMTKIYNIG